MMHERPRPPLSNALLTAFWLAQAVSLFGDRLNNFSLVALINTFSENPDLILSWTYFAMYLPVFTLAPLIGALIDRMDKGWTMVVTDVARGALVVLLPPLFSATGRFEPVLAIVFLLTVGNLFFLPAKSSLVPEIVPQNRLVRINATLWGAGIIGVIGGFLGGGLIFDYLSWEACFYLDGATYVFSALLLVGIAVAGRRVRPDVSVPRPARTSTAAALREGLSLLRRRKGLALPLGIQSIVFFGAGGFSVLAVVIIKENSPPGSSLGLSIAGLSIGLGMGLGSLLAGALSRLPARSVGAVCFAALAPASAVLALGAGLSAVGAGSFIAGLAATPLIVFSETSLQRESSPGKRGIIFSLREITTRCLFLVSAFLCTYLGRIIGKRGLLVSLGLVLAIIGISWIILSERRGGRDIPS